MNYIATKSLKSKGLAVFLIVLFGGIGLFYSSIIGGIIMTIIFPVIAFIIFFTGHFLLAICICSFYYIICLIWAINAVNDYNKRTVEYSSIYSQPNQESSTSESYDSPYNYYKKKDNSFTWLFITIFILFVIIGSYLYYFKK